MLDRAYLAEGVPTLIVWGRHDAIIPLGHGRLAHAAIPGSQFEVFDEAGHFPHHTDPARFVRGPARVRGADDPGRTFDREDWRVRLLRGMRPPATDAEMDPMEAPATRAELTLVEPPPAAKPGSQ